MEIRKVLLYASCTAILLSLILIAPSWAYEKEINALSAAMAEKIAKSDRTTVAVVDFTDLEGNVTQLGLFIAEEFSAALAGAEKGFKVVDRAHLNSILKEHKLSANGLIDPKTVRKLGKIISVESLITGTLTPFRENIRMTVKILDTATAEVIDATTGNIARTQGVEELLNKGVALGVPVTNQEEKDTASNQTQDIIGDTFFDDFNIGPKPDWNPVTGKWTMVNGLYTVTDIQSKETYTSIIDGKEWNNFILRVDVMPGYTNFSGVSRRVNEFRAYICPRITSAKKKICFGMNGTERKFDEFYWLIVKGDSGEGHVGWAEMETSKGEAVRVKIEVKDGNFIAYVNGMKVNQIYDASFTSGSVGLSQWYRDWDGKKIRTAFDNIEIKPLSD